MDEQQQYLEVSKQLQFQDNEAVSEVQKESPSGVTKTTINMFDGELFKNS